MSGQVIEGRSLNAGLSDARYKYLAKEHDTETGLEWLEARGYDSRVGRFLTIDPRAEEYPDVSPYAYAHNNPITWCDPSGRADTSGSENHPIPLPEVVVCGTRDETHVSVWLGIGGVVAAACGVGVAALDGPLPFLDYPGFLLSSGGTALLMQQLFAPPKDMLAQDSGKKELTGNVEKLAKRYGKTIREVKEAIHKVKGAMRPSGSVRNPDVQVDLNTGEVYPEAPGGGVGDSIGNILDYV